MIDAWLMVTRARFWMRGSGGLDGRSARSRCALRVVARRVVDGFMADLVAAGGRVAAGYGPGPDELTVVLQAEQRYLVEQVGRGNVGGASYADKAREDVRPGPATPL